jgi:hypothetical protein
VLRYIQIYPNPDRQVKLKTDFKELVFSKINALPNLQELAMRVDAFMTSSVHSPLVESKKLLLDEIMTREVLASLDVEYLKSIYHPKEIPEDLLTALNNSIKSKDSFKNPDVAIDTDPHDELHGTEH